MCALQRRADARCTPFLGEHPLTRNQRRFVPHVLPVPALQERNPMPVIVLSEPDYAP